MPFANPEATISNATSNKVDAIKNRYAKLRNNIATPMQPIIINKKQQTNKYLVSKFV